MKPSCASRVYCAYLLLILSSTACQGPHQLLPTPANCCSPPANTCLVGFTARKESSAAASNVSRACAAVSGGQVPRIRTRATLRGSMFVGDISASALYWIQRILDVSRRGTHVLQQPDRSFYLGYEQAQQSRVLSSASAIAGS
jgi:hypothetical protein